MRLEEARKIADSVAESMAPYCERVEIAGSIRRLADEVKDVEVVAVPKMILRPTAVLQALQVGELPEAAMGNMLHDWAENAAQQELIRWIKPGTPEIIDWPPKSDAKYLRGLIRKPPCDLKLDLFIARPENFGIILLIRTGSAGFSKAVADHALRRGTRINGGFITSHGVSIPTPEERDAFEYLGLQYVEPHVRLDGKALRQRPLVR